MSKKRIQAIILLLAATFIWGVTFPAVKYILGYINYFLTFVFNGLALPLPLAYLLLSVTEVFLKIRKICGTLFY